MTGLTLTLQILHVVNKTWWEEKHVCVASERWLKENYSVLTMGTAHILYCQIQLKPLICVPVGLQCVNKN